MQKDLSQLTPEERLEEAHRAIERLDETIKRIQAIIGERRMTPSLISCQIKSLWFVITVLAIVNILSLTGVGVVSFMGIKNNHEVEKSVIVMQQELAQTNKNIARLHLEINHANNHR